MNKTILCVGGGIALLVLGVLIGWRLGVGNVIEDTDVQPNIPSDSQTTTGTPGSTSNSTSKPAPAASATVHYTNSGFVPAMLEIKAGQTVKFVNDSSKTMWVKSIVKTAPFLALDQGTSLGRGKSWTYTFTNLGTWGYQNDNYPAHKAAIAVMPQ